MAWSKPEWSEPMGAKPTGAPPPKKRNARLVGALAGLLVILVSVTAYFMLAPSSGTVPISPGPATAAKPKKAPRPVVKPKPAPKPIAKPAPAPAKPEPPKPEYVKKPGQLQLPNGKILTFPPPAEGETRKVYAYGHLYECDHLGNFKDISKRPLFKTAFEENLLALASESKPFIPAFLMGLDETEVAKMLAKNYEPKGDETEEEKERLKAYDEMRAAALEYMGQGGKFDDFVGNIATFVQKERQTRANCLREVMTLYKQGKVAEAKEMANAAKILTDREGYKAIRLPPHVQQAFDEVQ